MRRYRKYTKELLVPLVAESSSVSQVIKKLGLKVAGGTYRHIQMRIKEYGIDTSHFTGQGWAKGLTCETSEGLRSMVKKRSFSSEEVFCKNSPIRGRGVINRLLKMGWEFKCSECGINEWRGMPLSVQLDHINGDNVDNRLENLRFLCPNCHSQTETWGAKNIKK